MDETRYNFNGDSVLETQVLGLPLDKDACIDLIDSLFNPPELQREWRSTYLSIQTGDNPFRITIEREIRLRIIRMGPLTGTLLAQFLDITYETEGGLYLDPAVDTDAATREYDQAKREADRELGNVTKWGSMDDGNSVPRFDATGQEVPVQRTMTLDLRQRVSKNFEVCQFRLNTLSRPRVS